MDVIEHLTGVRHQVGLDGSRCLVSILIVDHSSQVKALQPIVLQPTSGGEIRVGKRACPDYPETFPVGAFVVIEVTRLN